MTKRLFNPYFKVTINQGLLIFESDKKKVEMRVNEIRKVQLFPGMHFHTSKSGMNICGKGKWFSFAYNSVDEYESLVQQIHVTLIGNMRVKYIKGSYIYRLALILTLPFWLGFALFVIIDQISNYVHGMPFFIGHSTIILALVVILINYPQNIRDTKVEKYNPEIIIKYGPRILFDTTYQKEIYQKEDI